MRGLLTTVLTAVALIVAVHPLGATVYRTGNNIVIGPNEVIQDDLIAAGESVVVRGTVQGDLIAAASTIRVPGRVAGNVIVMAQRVDLSGATEGSLRAAAQMVDVSGSVGRNANLAAQHVTVTPEARFGRDLHAAAQRVTLDGDVEGRAGVAANAATVGGTVARNLRFEGRTLALEPGARVGGDLVVRSQRPVEIAPGAVVTGDVTRLAPRPEPAPAARTIALASNLLMAVALFVTGAIGLAIAPRFFRTAADMLDEQPGWSALWGLIALIVVPAAALLVALCVIGLPLSLVALAAWTVALLLSSIPVALFIGRHVSAWVMRGRTLSPWANLALGLLILAVLLSIPFINGLTMLAVAILGLGMYILAIQRLTGTGEARATGAEPAGGAAPQPA